ncbi:MAG: bacterial transcriptional activator domain-containing protein, partial [Pelovirga sp.]
WQAEQRLWRMERLWQGEFLNGYELDDELPGFRDQYNQLRLEQLQALAGLLVRGHEYQQAGGLLRAGLLLDPTADELIRQLLAIYHRQADTRAAERLLKDYRAALSREGYATEEIDELIDVFGTHWLSNSINHHRESGNNESL